MNLLSKDEFIKQCFEILSQSNNVDLIVSDIEELMSHHEITYLNAEGSLVNCSGVLTYKNGQDELKEALTLEVPNRQHLKVILNSHLNFLNAKW